MSRSTGPGDATPGPEQYRQGPPSPGPGAYGAPLADSTGGRPGSDLKRAGLAPKGVERSVTILEPAGREEQLERHGLHRGHRWAEAERRPRFSDELDASDADGDAEDERELEELGFLIDGGWTAIDSTRGSQGWTPGARDAGMTSHRGVLHPDEHVDTDALRTAVEAELGFTYGDVRAVYRQGRKSDAQLRLRARIDARLLELAESGSNMTALGRVLGFPVRAKEGDCQVIKRALERARDNEEART